MGRTKKREDIDIRYIIEDSDENDISRPVLLGQEDYNVYNMSKNRAFSYYFEDTSRTTRDRGGIVKFWDNDQKVSIYDRAELVAQSLRYNRKLGTFVFSDSTSAPQFQDPTGRFWIKGGAKCTEEYYHLEHKEKQYRVCMSGNKPSIQLGPTDVYSPDYETDYEVLKEFGKYLVGQYNQYVNHL